MSNYDAWKTRSDREDDPEEAEDNEEPPHPHPNRT
jgi:hypothetical protein